MRTLSVRFPVALCLMAAAVWIGLIAGLTAPAIAESDGDAGADSSPTSQADTESGDAASPGANSEARSQPTPGGSQDTTRGEPSTSRDEDASRPTDSDDEPDRADTPGVGHTATDDPDSGAEKADVESLEPVAAPHEDAPTKQQPPAVPDIDTGDTIAARPSPQPEKRSVTDQLAARASGVKPNADNTTPEIEQATPDHVAGAVTERVESIETQQVTDDVTVLTELSSALATSNILAANTIDAATSTTSQPAVQEITTITNVVTAPRQPSLVNLVGSLVFNIIGVALQVFSGAPVLPAGSNVTVRSSTLTMPGTGQTVGADWYFPENADSSTRIVYFQHGFMATGPMYSYTAAHLAEETNSIVVAPSLSSNLFDPDAKWIGGEPMQKSVADLFVGNRPELTESASEAAGRPVTLPTEFVLVGHSLGGALVTAAAGKMVDNGAIDNLQGVVLLDSVDMNNAIPTALGKLSGENYRPVHNISSERYVWSLHGLVGDQLEAARPGDFNGVVLVGGRHIDALQGGNPLLQFSEYVVAGFSQPQNIEAVKIIAAGWINDMFAGTHDGVYGAPQEIIEIPTSAGTATAVVLPFTSAESVQATPWDGLAEIILDVLFSFAVYEPLSGQESIAENPDAPVATVA